MVVRTVLCAVLEEKWTASPTFSIAPGSDQDVTLHEKSSA